MKILEWKPSLSEGETGGEGGGEELLDRRGGGIRKKGKREKKRSRTSRERVEVIAQGVDQTRKKEEKDKDMRKINAGGKRMSRSRYQSFIGQTLWKR